MYEIGITSRDKSRLIAGAMLFHATGAQLGGRPMFDGAGKPANEFKNRVASTLGGLHLRGNGVYYSGHGGRCGDNDKKSKYAVGFFNLDDPAGWVAFATTMGNRSTVVPLKTAWNIRTIHSTDSGYVASVRNGQIEAGCCSANSKTIREMISAIENNRVDRWFLADRSIESEPAYNRARSGSIIVSLDQLREMLAALGG